MLRLLSRLDEGSHSTLSVYLIVGGLAKLSEGLFSTPSYIGLGQVGFPPPSYFLSEEVSPTPSYLGLGVVPACGHHGGGLELLGAAHLGAPMNKGEMRNRATEVYKKSL